MVIKNIYSNATRIDLAKVFDRVIHSFLFFSIRGEAPWVVFLANGLTRISENYSFALARKLGNGIWLREKRLVNSVAVYG